MILLSVARVITHSRVVAEKMFLFTLMATEKMSSLIILPTKMLSKSAAVVSQMLLSVV